MNGYKLYKKYIGSKFEQCSNFMFKWIRIIIADDYYKYITHNSSNRSSIGIKEYKEVINFVTRGTSGYNDVILTVIILGARELMSRIVHTPTHNY